MSIQPGGILASSDLSSEAIWDNHDALPGMWQRVMAPSDGLPPEGFSRMKAAYAKVVAVLLPTKVASIIQAGGFEASVQFFQAGLIHAWFAKRASGNVA
jgi:tRNA (cmo5U34)-methyltransferase